MSANPLRTPEAFDQIIIGGTLMPGLAKVSRAKRVWKWDKKEGPGTSGDTLTFRGVRTSDFLIRLEFWLAEQIDEWDHVQPALEPDERNIRAQDVIHPSLERLKIRSIIVEGISALEHAGQGLYYVEIGVNEYKPPPKKSSSGTPSSSKAGGGNGRDGTTNPPRAKTAQEEEIERLLAEARRP